MCIGLPGHGEPTAGKLAVNPADRGGDRVPAVSGHERIGVADVLGPERVDQAAAGDRIGLVPRCDVALCEVVGVDHRVCLRSARWIAGAALGCERRGMKAINAR